MSTRSPSFEELLCNTAPPEWLLDMHDHYAETGSFRTEDILRVLGDPKKGVEMASEDRVKSCFLVSKE